MLPNLWQRDPSGTKLGYATLGSFIPPGIEHKVTILSLDDEARTGILVNQQSSIMIGPAEQLIETYDMILDTDKSEKISSSPANHCITLMEATKKATPASLARGW